LHAFCRRHQITPFMALLAVYYVLLHRYTGSDDIAVGTPVGGRPRTEFEQLIGFFVNTLVLRVRFRSAMTFLELLDEVREACVGAYAHQNLPFEQLVDAMQPSRNLARHPLFQVMFALENFPKAEEQLPELEFTRVAVEECPAKFDLTLILRETAEG